MSLYYTIIPAFTAFATWFAVWLPTKFVFYPEKPQQWLGFKIQGLIPYKKSQLIESIVTTAEQIFTFEQIENHIANPENLQKIMPLAEEQIDYFLRNKLIKSMPMISMFIGDKTIDQLKKIFLEELNTLFPTAIKAYVASMKHNINLESIIRKKVEIIIHEKIEPALKKAFKKEAKRVSFIAALFGLAIGLLQLWLINFIN